MDVKKIEKTNFDAIKLVEQYINNKTWLIKENANGIYSHSGMSFHLSGEILKNYWLNKIYDDKIKTAHETGEIHIHDLSLQAPYCTGLSLSDLIWKGLIAPQNRISSNPAKHFSTITEQIVNFMGIMSQEFAGAVAFNNVSTLLAPFIYYDKLTYNEVKQTIQRMVYSLNQPSRWSGQAIFSNFTLDLTPHPELAEQNVFVAEEKKTKYKDHQKEIDMFNKAITEVIMEGDSTGRSFTFPIPTINIYKDFDWESEKQNIIFEASAKKGVFYFENYVNSSRDPSSTRSLCCRLSLSLKDLNAHTGGLFGNGDNTGSIGVVTINLNRVAYLAKRNKKEFFKILDNKLNLAKKSLEIKRNVIETNMENNLYPYSKIYIKNYRNYFSTLGIIGGEEMCVNMFGKSIIEPECKQFSIEVLEYIVNKAKEYSKETKHLFNVEEVPGEGAMRRLADLDFKLFPKIYVSGKDTKYLNNGLKPPMSGIELIDFIKHQETIQNTYTGGSTIHLYLGEQINTKQCKDLVKRVITQTKIPYFSITPVYSICPKHGVISGEHYKCPLHK